MRTKQNKTKGKGKPELPKTKTQNCEQMKQGEAYRLGLRQAKKTASVNNAEALAEALRALANAARKQGYHFGYVSGQVAQALANWEASQS